MTDRPTTRQLKYTAERSQLDRDSRLLLIELLRDDHQVPIRILALDMMWPREKVEHALQTLGDLGLVTGALTTDRALSRVAIADLPHR